MHARTPDTKWGGQAGQRGQAVSRTEHAESLSVPPGTEAQDG